MLQFDQYQAQGALQSTEVGHFPPGVDQTDTQAHLAPDQFPVKIIFLQPPQLPDLPAYAIAVNSPPKAGAGNANEHLQSMGSGLRNRDPEQAQWIDLECAPLRKQTTDQRLAAQSFGFGKAQRAPGPLAFRIT